VDTKRDAKIYVKVDENLYLYEDAIMDTNLKSKLGASGGAKLGENYGTRKLDAKVDTITEEKEM